MSFNTSSTFSELSELAADEDEVFSVTTSLWSSTLSLNCYALTIPIKDRSADAEAELPAVSIWRILKPKAFKRGPSLNVRS